MYYQISYDQEFYDLYMYLRGKYPQELFDLEGIGRQTDMHQFAKEFFKAGTTSDASVDANANVDAQDVIGYTRELPKPFFRMNSYFLLWEKLRDLYGLATANYIIEQQLNGTIYINDFSDVGRPYCFNFSCMDVLTQGLPMVHKIKSTPPKYLYSFMAQLENFILLASNSTSGATGLADLFICMSWYVQKMVETYKDGHFTFQTTQDVWAYVKEQLVSFVYTINQPMRGAESPFTNVSLFDDAFMSKLCESYVFPDGSHPNVMVVQHLQTIFLELMNEELRRTPVTFPVTTACFSVDEKGEILDEKFAEHIAAANQEFGFINIYCGKTSTLASCCRLRSDTDNEYFNSFGSGSTKIGSLGVVTLNLPRLALQCVDFEGENPVDDFMADLSELVYMAGKINNAKRDIIKSRINKGFMPLYTYGFMELDRQYSTVGVTGINEACEILGFDILEPSGQHLVLDMLEVINSTNDILTRHFRAPHNCEQVPAETSAIKLATKDRLLDYQDQYELYSNQFIPLTTKADMLDRIKLQGMFDKDFSGGAICHINISERVKDYRAFVSLIKHCAKAGVVYWAANYVLLECAEGHMSVGSSDTCSICGKPIVNQYTRVVGFLTSVKNWHKVRREHDFPQRVFYTEDHHD